MSLETIASGRYRVERELGHGAMATVLLAHDRELDRSVAVKVLDEKLADDESFRARFAREARMAASLSHPNVVTVFDVGETDGVPYIVMEFVEGRPLDERLGQHGPLPPDDVRAIALQVCEGLAHAHDNGLVHRDLKPGNLIARSDGTIKIADFGIARALEATELTEAGTILGTAAYLAPEQADGAEVTPATDLFTLGVVLYELLTARQPWQIDSVASLAARRTAPPAELPAETPADLREAIERCLALDPRDRPDSARDVARLLDGGGEAATVVMRAPAPTAVARRPRPARRRSSGALWLGALLGAIVLVLAALALAVARPGSDPDDNASTPPRLEAPADGATPQEDARNLAEWLRANAR